MAVVELVELGMPWNGLDPFIFTVHHLDDYPAGADDLGPTVDAWQADVVALRANIRTLRERLRAAVAK